MPLFCVSVSMTRVLWLMHNDTLMNIVFPGFAIDLFLMSHGQFCTPALEHGTWPSAIWEPRFLSHGSVWWLCEHVLCSGVFCWVVGVLFFFGWFLVGVFFATDGCCICCSGFLQASLDVAVFYCIQAILEKELCCFLQLKTKHCQCWCFSSGTEITANSCSFIQPWDQKLP